MKALAQDIKNAISAQISGTLMQRFLSSGDGGKGAHCDDAHAAAESKHSSHSKGKR